MLAKGRMAMNRTLLAVGALMLSALLIPSDAEAQRFGGHGGGGGGRIGGGFGGGGAFRGGGAFGGASFGGPRMFVHQGGMGGFRAGAIAAPRPGRSDFRMATIGRPGYGIGAPYYGQV